MAGRLAWILAGGAAIVGGWAIQDGDFFSFSDERSPDREIDRAIDEARDERGESARIVVPADRRRSEADAETIEALTEAVQALVKAETALAAASLERDSDPEGYRTAQLQRDRARAMVEELRADIEMQGAPAAVREQVREQIRTEVREAVRNN